MDSSKDVNNNNKMIVQLVTKIEQLILALIISKNNNNPIITVDEYDGQILKQMYDEELNEDERKLLMI